MPGNISVRVIALVVVLAWLAVSFTELNNSNWQCLAMFRMEMLPTREELWYVVSREHPEAPTTIRLCIEVNQDSFEKSENSALSYWDQLRGYHEKATVTSQMSPWICGVCRLPTADWSRLWRVVPMRISSCIWCILRCSMNSSEEENYTGRAEKCDEPMENDEWI